MVSHRKYVWLLVNHSVLFLSWFTKSNPQSLFYSYKPQDLILHGDISFGAEEFFANEAKMALRLANFISAFLQVICIN